MIKRSKIYGELVKQVSKKLYKSIQIKENTEE